MWSSPSCVSSSRTRISVDFQNLEWEIPSTICPTARSLSARQAFGVEKPGVFADRAQLLWARGCRLTAGLRDTSGLSPKKQTGQRSGSSPSNPPRHTVKLLLLWNKSANESSNVPPAHPRDINCNHISKCAGGSVGWLVAQTASTVRGSSSSESPLHKWGGNTRAAQRIAGCR